MGSEYVKFCPVCNETRQNMEWCDDEKLKEFSKGYHNVLVPKEGLTICPACKKGILEDSVLTHDEFNLIEDVSNSDRQFLEARIELKKNDPIEYQLKMSQFKANLKQQESSNSANTKPKEENKVHCPYCNSTNVNKISGLSKAGSIAMFGIFSRKAHKQWHCNSCKSDF